MAHKKIKKKRKSLSKFEIAFLIIALGIIVYLLFPNLSPGDESEEQFMFKKDGELTFLDSTGKPITKIDIEISETDFDRQLGLMYRKKMGETQGMLFIFPVERMQSFWMKNTFISLDMIFVNANNEIVTIHKNTTPRSEQSYASTEPAKYVVEVDAGFTDQFNINVGDKINWKRTD